MSTTIGFPLSFIIIILINIIIYYYYSLCNQLSDSISLQTRNFFPYRNLPLKIVRLSFNHTFKNIMSYWKDPEPVIETQSLFRTFCMYIYCSINVHDGCLPILCLQVSSVHRCLPDLLQQPPSGGVHQLFAKPPRAHVKMNWRPFY